MAYNLKISGEDAKVLNPEQEIVDGIIQGVVQSSTILPLMTRLPNMITGEASMNVLDTLPVTYWVDEDTANGRKQTTRSAWSKKKIKAEEIAVIVPIKKNVFNDAKYNIWEQIRPLIVENAYKVIDEAIILGKNKPTDFREGLIPSIINVGKDVAPSTDNLYTQISKAMSEVEESGYDVNAILGGVSLKGAFREGLVDTTGQPLNPSSEVLQLAKVYAKNGAWDNTLAKFIVGDFKQAVYAIREDANFEVFDTGVITDASGNVVYNLLQDDMVALRFTMRLGWEIPNPINILDDTVNRFPFALVQPTAEPTTYTVTFTVTDSSSAAVSGAKVEFGGQTKLTNSSGVAVFETLGNTSSLYRVSKTGANDRYGKTTVATSNVTVDIENF